LRDTAPALPSRRAHLVRDALGRGPAPPLLRDHRSRTRPAGAGARRVERLLPRSDDPARDQSGGDAVTPTTAVPPEVSEYLAAVRAALDDLPATERDDLLAEVEVSLLDAASETGGNVSARLGPAEDFAAELRSAAGLQVPPRRSGAEPRLLVAARRLAR